jgi:hypothetical protein
VTKASCHSHSHSKGESRLEQSPLGIIEKISWLKDNLYWSVIYISTCVSRQAS